MDVDDGRITAQKQFLALTEALLAGAGVERSTMMGLPCLRWHGDVFASFDRRTGDLLVKPSEARVDELVAAGRTHPFAPAGRRFRQWAAVDGDLFGGWPEMLDEAIDAARQRGAAPSDRPADGLPGVGGQDRDG